MGSTSFQPELAQPKYAGYSDHQVQLASTFQSLPMTSYQMIQSLPTLQIHSKPESTVVYAQRLESTEYKPRLGATILPPVSPPAHIRDTSYQHLVTMSPVFMTSRFDASLHALEVTTVFASSAIQASVLEMPKQTLVTIELSVERQTTLGLGHYISTQLEEKLQMSGQTLEMTSERVAVTSQAAHVSIRFETESELSHPALLLQTKQSDSVSYTHLTLPTICSV